MQRNGALLLMVGVMAVALVAGCSKKPPPEELVPPPDVTARELPTSDDRERLGDETLAPATGTEQAALEDVFFDFDKYNLSARARQSLVHDGDYLRSNPSTRILIEGHCDDRGTREYNLALGDRRARAARDFLIDYGIDPTRIETISYGEERPFSLGQTESAWAKNRRAHFVVQN